MHSHGTPSSPASIFRCAQSFRPQHCNRTVYAFIGGVSCLALLLSLPASAQMRESQDSRASSDWMLTGDALAARVRPADQSTVEQSPPDFGWPDVSADAKYQLTLTYPDGRTQTRAAPQNWFNWPAVLPPGRYSWQVRISDSSGARLSNKRSFTVATDAKPFVVPDSRTLLATVKARTHPRGLPDDATLRAMAGQRQAPLRALMADVNGRRDARLPQEPSASAGTGSANDAAYEACKRALKSLAAYVLSRDDAMATDAVRHIMNLASWDPRGATAYARVDMASRFIAWTAALGYDWLSPRLDSEQKSRILAMLKLRAGDMHADIIGARARIAKYPRDSHGNQTLTILAVISALLAGDLPEADTWLTDTLPLAINATSPWAGEEGGFANSSTQALWDMGELLLPWYVTRWATGVDFAQKAWVRNWARYAAYFMPPGTPAGVFGDGLEMNLAENAARFGKAYAHFVPSPLARWHAARLNGEDKTRIEYLLSPPASMDPPASDARVPPGTRHSVVLPDIGQVAMHSDLSDRKRTSVYFKSSPAPFGAFNHSHADQNSFVINAGGERLAIESGYYDNYKTEHWMKWYHQTRAKNAITFDGGQGQVFFEQDGRMGYGALTRFELRPELDIVTGDATPAYGGALSKAVRSMMYLRPNLILVHDVLASDTPRQWEWNIHALNAIETISDTKIRIESKGQSLCVDMLSGPAMRFTQTNMFTSDPSGGQARNWTRQWHGRFYSTKNAASAKFVALLDVGCTGARVNIGTGPHPLNAQTVTINNQMVRLSDQGITLTTPAARAETKPASLARSQPTSPPQGPQASQAPQAPQAPQREGPQSQP